LEDGMRVEYFIVVKEVVISHFEDLYTKEDKENPE
jgi:hypothetical protein